jgi:hypothetical protein
MIDTATGSATIVFSRKLGPEQHDKYEAWLGRVTAATNSFAGYGGTTLLRPAAPNEEYTAILHFDTTEHLERWLTSAERTECLKALEDIAIESEEISSLAGLDHWVSLKGGMQPPPDWKMAVLILVGLYPIVVLDAMFLGPLLTFLPWPVGILVSLMVSVPIMVWIVLPVLSKLLRPWLGAKRD